MKILIWCFVAAAGLAAFVGLSGWLIPPRYETSAPLRVEATPEAVWQVLSTVDEYPGWRSDVAIVERLGNPVDPVWRETDARGGVMRHDAGEGRVAEKFIDRFESEGPAGNRGVPGGVAAGKGERIFLIIPDPQGKTRISITERGEITGPLARFRARFITGYDKGVRKLAEDLRHRLAE